MRLTIAFPNVGQPYGRAALRDYALALEGLGVDHLNVVDHVVYAFPGPGGAPRSRYRGDMWQLEAFATLGFIAGVTDRVGLDASMVILPQRPPALVAKEAATIDVLSGGRLRLGVAVGWQEAEYEALGVPFRERGARMEEAMPIVRSLLSDERVTFRGRYNLLDNVGMEPKPIQRPFPIIMGGADPRALERAGRLADGWAAGTRTTPEAFETMKDHVLDAARAAGRKEAIQTLKGSVVLNSPDPFDTLEILRRHKRAGATDIQYWMGTAQGTHLRELSDKLRYVETLIRDVWPQI